MSVDSRNEKPIDRIAQFIQVKGIAISAFEKAVGLSNNSIQTAIKRSSNLKDETLILILKQYPELSTDWVLHGTGNMTQVVWDGVGEDRNPTYVIRLQKEYIKKLEAELKALKKQITLP